MSKSPLKTLFQKSPKFELSDVNINPDHNALGSFVSNDIQNGAFVLQPPITQIAYRWHNGESIAIIDEQSVGQIDSTLDTMITGRDDTLASASQTQSANDYPQVPSLEPGQIGKSVRTEAKQDLREGAVAQSKRQPAHCGLYCLYSILRLNGRELGFRELVKPEYFGSRKGSTLAELGKAVKDYGLHGGVAVRLTTRALKECPYSAILHVKSSAESKEYDHYELFMGAENGKAKLFDPPESPKLVPFRELAPRWDGKGIFISSTPFELDRILGPDRQRLLLYGVVAIIVVTILHLARRVWLALGVTLPRRWFIRLTVGQGAAIATAALMFGLICHLADDEQGFLANANATASLQKGHLGNFIPKVGERTVRRLLDTDAVFIDARMPFDYEAGHLDGAISVPVDANDFDHRERTADIARDSPIVVYCQSAGCKFAERVAAKLIEDGFSNISIFKGGWHEWVTKNGNPAKTLLEKMQ